MTESSHATSNTPASTALPWTLDDIPYAHIERDRVAGEDRLFYLLTGASFVEITSDLYTDNLVDYYAGDGEVQDWLRAHWQPEELQHGRALRRYVQTVWPDFDWEAAYQRFLADYTPLCKVETLGPTQALELAARCVVETGTSSLYTMVQQLSPEPVLRQLAGHIRSDEVRHYKYFYHFYLRYRERERTPRRTVLATLWSRLAEIDDEDAYLAFKHAWLVRHENATFRAEDYRYFRRQSRDLIRRHYPYAMAIKMLLKPLRLPRRVQRASLPLLTAGARHLLLR